MRTRAFPMFHMIPTANYILCGLCNFPEKMTYNMRGREHFGEGRGLQMQECFIGKFPTERLEEPVLGRTITTCSYSCVSAILVNLCASVYLELMPRPFLLLPHHEVCHLTVLPLWQFLSPFYPFILSLLFSSSWFHASTTMAARELTSIKFKLNGNLKNLLVNLLTPFENGVPPDDFR